MAARPGVTTGREAQPRNPGSPRLVVAPSSRPAGPPARARARSQTLPVLASGDHSVLLGDEQRGRDGVLVALDLAQQHRAAALRPGVDLGRHVRAAASPAGGPSADRRAGTRRLLRATGPRVRHAAVSSRAPPQHPVLPRKAARIQFCDRGDNSRKARTLRKVKKPNHSPRNVLIWAVAEHRHLPFKQYYAAPTLRSHCLKARHAPISGKLKSEKI